MILHLSKEVLGLIHKHAEESYPEEGAGFLFGTDQTQRTVLAIYVLLIGVFHSHPDHPNKPSEFDMEWAQPFFSYIITSVDTGKAIESKSWRLLDDRSRFEEEKIKITI